MKDTLAQDLTIDVIRDYSPNGDGYPGSRLGQTIAKYSNDSLLFGVSIRC